MSLQRVVSRTGTTIRMLFRPYSKQGNAYAYIPVTSFHWHGRHTFRGWVLAELLRLLAHSSTPELWREEGSIFYHHLCSRGYLRSFLRTAFKRSHGHAGCSYMLKAAKKSAMSFSDLLHRADSLTFKNRSESRCAGLGKKCSWRKDVPKGGFCQLFEA